MLSSKSPGFLSGQDGRFAAFDAVLRAANRSGWVEGQDAAAGQPVEQHADGGEVLLDGRGGFGAGELLDVGGDVYRLDAGQGEAAVLTLC